jgi:hypothetical protein
MNPTSTHRRWTEMRLAFLSGLANWHEFPSAEFRFAIERAPVYGRRRPSLKLSADSMQGLELAV